MALYRIKEKYFPRANQVLQEHDLEIPGHLAALWLQLLITLPGQLSTVLAKDQSPHAGYTFTPWVMSFTPQSIEHQVGGTSMLRLFQRTEDSHENDSRKPEWTAWQGSGSEPGAQFSYNIHWYVECIESTDVLFVQNGKDRNINPNLERESTCSKPILQFYWKSSLS